MMRVYCTRLFSLGPMLKAVLFDLDGTLTHSDAVHYQVFQTLFAEAGITLTPALYRQKISGHQNQAILAEFLPQLSEQEAAAWSDRKEALFRQAARDQLKPLPGLHPLLADLADQNLSAAVVTNAPRENADFMLAVLGLSDRFHPVVIGDELPKAKPDPMPYQVALARLAVEATAALAFEDSATGLTAAVAAGIPTIGVTTTHTPETLMELGAIATVADFTDPLICRWLTRIAI